MKNFHFVSLLGLTALLLACGPKEAEKKSQPLNSSLISVKLGEVSQANTAESLRASGIVSSLSEARLSFKTGGIIARIFVKEGQTVAQGQLLATLNMTEISAQVQQANEGVLKAERDLKRVTNLYRDSVATLEQVQNLTTALNVAKQNSEIAQYNQQYSQIVAPFSGVIVKKILNEGELTGPGAPVFFLNASSANDWVLKVGIADRDWARLRIGDRASVNLDAFDNQNIIARIFNLSQGADPTSGLYTAELKLQPAPGVKLATGLFGSAVIQPSKKQNYTAIPVDALVEGAGDEAFVFTVENGKARKLPIKVAYLTNSTAYLASGLVGVRQVVIEGSAYLTEGSQVSVK
jgi:membrane fusion protein, multidrug efflux system